MKKNKRYSEFPYEKFSVSPPFYKNGKIKERKGDRD